MSISFNHSHFSLLHVRGKLTIKLCQSHCVSRALRPSTQGDSGWGAHRLEVVPGTLERLRSFVGILGCPLEFLRLSLAAVSDSHWNLSERRHFIAQPAAYQISSGRSSRGARFGQIGLPLRPADCGSQPIAPCPDPPCGWWDTWPVLVSE